MTEYAQLWLFFLILLGVVMLPGVDMAYVLGSALSGGRRHGMIAVTGIMAGGVVHVTVGALGLAALINYLPGAFNLILLAGALYIAWIGFSLLRSASFMQENGLQEENRHALPSRMITFRRGAIVSLLNPKAYLFMLAIFPQFLRPEYGALWVQAIVLGVIIAFTQAGVYGSIALLAGGLRDWLQRTPTAGIILNRTVGAVLVLTAIAAGMDGWRSM